MVHYNAVLVLSDGRHFFGRSLGEPRDRIVEVCFTTGPTGYQYTITDPSFAGQIIVFAFPHIGNVGINGKDFECEHVLASGIVVREISCASHPSSRIGLDSWMKNIGLSGISGVDTRALTLHLREHGTTNGVIHHFSDINRVDIHSLKNAAIAMPPIAPATNLKHLKDRRSSQDGTRICILDFGTKQGIIDALTSLGCAVDIVAAKENFAARIMELNPEGIVISNGPGNPADIPQHVINQLRILLEQDIPILGICLGHQILATALGAQTIKMPHGHRGSNHPVYNLETGTVEVTSQNHGFTIDTKTLPKNVQVTHVSLFDGTAEGIRLIDRHVFSVQYHPEGCPGPCDSHYIFENFVSLVRSESKVYQTADL